MSRQRNVHDTETSSNTNGVIAEELMAYCHIICTSSASWRTTKADDFQINILSELLSHARIYLLQTWHESEMQQLINFHKAHKGIYMDALILTVWENVFLNASIRFFSSQIFLWKEKSILYGLLNTLCLKSQCRTDFWILFVHLIQFPKAKQVWSFLNEIFVAKQNKSESYDDMQVR